MDDSLKPIINLVPEHWRATALLAVFAAPHITRAAHALMNGRGICGMFSAILFGTNAPKQQQQQPTNEK